MTPATRSLFTEAIEDHLSLKKQNSALNAAMPVDRYDVGDPLDRYPGGPVKPALGADPADAGQTAADASPAQSATATAHEESAFRQPMNGMAPMLSLVEDVDEDEIEAAAALAAAPVSVAPTEAEVVRFPGGVGPRDHETPDAAVAATAVISSSAAATTSADATADSEAEATGEQPVIVIDADEPISPPAPSMRNMPGADGKPKRPSFFGLGKRRKNKKDDVKGSGWFSSEPRDFHWDD